MENLKKKLKKYKYNFLEIFIIAGSIFILSCFIWDNRNIVPDIWHDIITDFGSTVNKDTMLDPDLINEGINQFQNISNISEEDFESQDNISK